MRAVACVRSGGIPGSSDSKKRGRKKVNSWRKESEEHSVQAGALLSLLMKLEKKSVDAFNVGEEYWFSMRSEGSGPLGTLGGEGGKSRGGRGS